ncbi:MAG: dihydrolipoyl dehydrogenase [Enterobacteriaceae bacterium]|nr:dihydrolipoyl dehydrogenase [Enterobacteriaceae bacterium]
MLKIKTNLVIVGSGPAGYTSALRASTLNIETIMIEKDTTVGGTCLNKGCIPIKALLNVSKFINSTKHANEFGITCSINNINLKKIHVWKNNIIKNLDIEIKNLCKTKKVKILHGQASFINKNLLHVKTKHENISIEFNTAIIATGSIPKISNFEKKIKDIINSDKALELKIIPKKILIIGCGAVGLELSNIFSSLNSIVDIVDTSKNILPEIDTDITDVLETHIKKYNINIYKNTEIENIEKKNEEFIVTYNNKTFKKYNLIISAIGRVPNTNKLNIKNIEISTDINNFICVNDQQQTNIKNIYACGDVTGQPMLAHKAMYDGKLAAEVIAGYAHFSQKKCIPQVIYTNPEIAYVGILENLAIKKKINHKTYKYLWKNNGRAMMLNSLDGLTKIIFNEKNIIIGAAIIGDNASELISELSLAIEMGCYKDDLSLTIHPHPTLSETIIQAIETKN